MIRRKFRRVATYLKHTVVVNTRQTIERRIHIDSTLCDGTRGTAFLLLKIFPVNGNKNDLNTSACIIEACDSASASFRDVTFLRGSAGACALGAVVSKYQENTQHR
ncbi:hypothetical protein Lser_V15G36667 [Lactuca serriola]